MSQPIIEYRLEHELKGIIHHELAQVPKKDRVKKTFYVPKSEKRHRESVGFTPPRDKLSKSDRHRNFLNVTLTDQDEANSMALDAYYESLGKVRSEFKPYRYELSSDSDSLLCLCGYKGMFARVIEPLENGEKTHFTCPECGCDDFHEISFNLEKVIYLGLFQDEKSIRLLWITREFRGINGKIRSFKRRFSMIYNKNTHIVYFRKDLPAGRSSITNATYETDSTELPYYIREICSSPETKKLYFLFLVKCFKNRGFDPKTTYPRIKEWIQGDFQKYVFHLLRMPAMSVFPTEFGLAARYFPTNVKRYLANAPERLDRIVKDLTGSKNKKVKKWILENQLDCFTLYTQLFPYFENKYALIDLLERFRSREGDKRPMGKQQFSLLVRAIRETKKFYQSEETYRNELIRYATNHSLWMLDSYLDDIYGLIKDLRLVIPSKKIVRKNSLIKWHDELVKQTLQYAEKILAKKGEAASQPLTDYSPDEQILEMTEPTHRFRFVQTEHELSLLGKVFRNCVGGYGDRVRRKDSYVLVLENHGIPRVCIELQKDQKQFVLQQSYMYANSKMDETHKTLVRHWVDEKKIKDDRGFTKNVG